MREISSIRPGPRTSGLFVTAIFLHISILMKISGQDGDTRIINNLKIMTGGAGSKN
jgi:hypothetical protein